MDSVPVYIWHHIFTFLPVEDFGRLEQVSTHYKLNLGESFWKLIYLLYFENISEEEDDEKWKQKFLKRYLPIREERRRLVKVKESTTTFYSPGCSHL
jgi:hypothetical protein